jgi:YD repeat-containing protein
MEADLLGFITLHPTYDPPQADNRVVSVTRNGHITTTTYTKSGRPDLVTDAAGRTIDFQYNGKDFLERVIDPAGNFKALAYDTLGNLTGRTYITGGPTPSAQQPEYAYAHDGRRITKTVGAEVTVYHYDLAGRFR